MKPVKQHAIEKTNVRRAVIYFLLGLSSIIIGILSILYDFQELALTERIKVRPGLPAYEMWRNPSAIGVDIGIKVFLFHVENPDEFLSNQKAKLKLSEIGPIVYKKVMRQENIVFHDQNSTMSFSTVFDLVFDEERSKPGILNDTITMANPMLLAFAAMAHDMFLARMAFNLVAKEDHVFINRTVYEALWDNSSPIFDFVKRIPFAAPRRNAGIMHNSFYPSDQRYNVNIGPKHGYKDFFKIQSFNGLPRIDAYRENYPDHCPYSLKGASEGTGLPPHLGKGDVIYAYTKNLCRTYPMVFNHTVKIYGFQANKYVLADEIYTRLNDSDLDCLKTTGDVLLPDGLSDASKCAFGLPVAVSNPHFWGYHGKWEDYLDGLAPNVEKHSSYVVVEPVSGVQIDGIARLQSNLPLPSLNHFSQDVRRFSGMILPQFWMEYFMINRVTVIHAMVIIFLNLPKIQFVFVICTLVLSVHCLWRSVRIMIRIRKSEDTPSEAESAMSQQQLLMHRDIYCEADKNKK